MNASVNAIAAIPADRSASSGLARFASATLRTSAAFWYVATVAGQLFFAAYVVLFYGRAVADGDLSRWNKVLGTGYVPGDTIGNLVLASHLVLAVAVMLSGALQLMPSIRRHAPRLHRWNGRFFIVSAIAAGIGGFVMNWTRSTVGDLTQHISISVNAALIVAFAVLAWRNAIARRFDVHRRWALRLFLVVSGVWFFRITLSLWIAVNQGPVGFDPNTFTGPFLTFLSFTQYSLPLVVLELYFLAQASRDARARLAMAGGLFVIALATMAGTAAAASILWLPRL